MDTQVLLNVKLSFNIVCCSDSTGGFLISDCLRWLYLRRQELYQEANVVWTCAITCWIEPSEGYYEIYDWEKIKTSRRYRDMECAVHFYEAELEGLSMGEVRQVLSRKLDDCFEKMFVLGERKVSEGNWGHARSLTKQVLEDLAFSERFFVPARLGGAQAAQPVQCEVEIYCTFQKRSDRSSFEKSLRSLGWNCTSMVAKESVVSIPDDEFLDENLERVVAMCRSNGGELDGFSSSSLSLERQRELFDSLE